MCLCVFKGMLCVVCVDCSKLCLISIGMTETNREGTTSRSFKDFLNQFPVRRQTAKAWPLNPSGRRRVFCKCQTCSDVLGKPSVRDDVASRSIRVHSPCRSKSRRRDPRCRITHNEPSGKCYFKCMFIQFSFALLHAP